jgi:precorrin-2 dehydrogenase / sirohydrochlorin ferrochelatase
MIPVAIDPSRVSVVLAGAGPAAVKRLAWLREAGADPLVFAPDADGALAERAGDRLRRYLPDDGDLRSARLLFAAGLADADARALAGRASALGLIVNVEDVVDLCDVHVPAVVRRGGLLLAISTGGASPGLAKRIRARLEALFPPVWGERLARVADERTRLRAQGADMAAVDRAVADIVDKEGWFA